MTTQERIRYLRTRKYLYDRGLWIVLEGKLQQKSKRGARDEAERLRLIIQEHIEQSRWKLRPRAKIAALMEVFGWSRQAPAPDKLAKYYLDLFEGLAFRDDRQVEYVEVITHRGGDSTQAISIQIRPLSDYRQLYKLYQEARHVVDVDLDRYPYDDERIVSYDIDYVKIGMERSIASAEDTLRDLARYTGKGYEPTRRFDPHLAEKYRQAQTLSNSRISRAEYPVAPQHWEAELIEMLERDPFVVQLGELPREGESHLYREGVGRAFKKFSQRIPTLRELRLPIDVDLRVTPSQEGLPKDIDNLMLEMMAIFRDALVEKGGDMRAFRAYVGPSIGMNHKLRVKVLPAGAIAYFKESMEKSLEQMISHFEDAL